MNYLARLIAHESQLSPLPEDAKYIFSNSHKGTAKRCESAKTLPKGVESAPIAEPVPTEPPAAPDLTPEVAAREILAGAYFNLALGGVWLVCWTKRDALKRFGQLTGKRFNEYEAAIAWAKTQIESEKD